MSHQSVASSCLIGQYQQNEPIRCMWRNPEAGCMMFIWYNVAPTHLNHQQGLLNNKPSLRTLRYGRSDIIERIWGLLLVLYELVSKTASTSTWIFGTPLIPITSKVVYTANTHSVFRASLEYIGWQIITSDYKRKLSYGWKRSYFVLHITHIPYIVLQMHRQDVYSKRRTVKESV